MQSPDSIAAADPVPELNPPPNPPPPPADSNPWATAMDRYLCELFTHESCRHVLVMIPSGTAAEVPDAWPAYLGEHFPGILQVARGRWMCRMLNEWPLDRDPATRRPSPADLAEIAAWLVCSVMQTSIRQRFGGVCQIRLQMVRPAKECWYLWGCAAGPSARMGLNERQLHHWPNAAESWGAGGPHMASRFVAEAIAQELVSQDVADGLVPDLAAWLKTLPPSWVATMDDVSKVLRPTLAQAGA